MFWKVSKNLLKLSRSILTFIELNSNKKKYPPYLAFLVFQNSITIDQVPDEFKEEVQYLLDESFK
ncbi:hypothetical protein CPT_MarsHill_081 [Staphylococcus phage MarsHill]|nr:hypothetical protein CPT_MarsHill_081 [Staphylococcus phage MarsHill]QQO92736.1 hypothetical protein CPT_Madawaska_081 [Staphylococcus phage Madawaska]